MIHATDILRYLERRRSGFLRQMFLTMFVGVVLVYNLMATRSRIFSIYLLRQDLLFHLPTLAFTVFAVFRYFYWLRRRREKHGYSFFLALGNFIGLVGIVLCVFIHPLNIVLFGTTPTWKQQVGFAVVSNIVLMLGVGALYLFARNVLTHNRLYKAEAEKAHYQMDALRMQVQPHFLYNALNTAASLIHEDSAKAEEFLQELSSIYRYLTEQGSKQTVTVREEMDFTRAYIYLQCIRFGDKMRVEMNVDERWNERLIVPVSLQMMVENALKHNIHTEAQPLHITVEVTEEGIEVRNNIQRRPDSEQSGNGLRNLKRQYELLEKTVEITDDGTTFCVRLPFVDKEPPKDNMS